MKTVYLAHPYSAPTAAERDANRARAARWAAWALTERGVSPSCSWIVLTGELPESPENRRLGMAADLAQVEQCTELWLVGGRVTPGMAEEAEYARLHNIPVFNFTSLGDEPPTRPSDTEPVPADESGADWGVVA